MSTTEQTRTPEEINANVAKLQAETALTLAQARREDREETGKDEERLATVAKLQAETAYALSQARKEAYAADAAEIQLKKTRREAALDDAGDTNNRIYHFTAPVNASESEKCMQTLAKWARVSDEPIVLNFHSPGGSVLDGLRLYDFIRQLVADGIEVTTVTLGMAASMAGVLLQAGSRRVAGPQASILVHEVAGGAIGKIGELEDMTEFAKKLNDRLFGILTERAKISKKALLAKARRKDHWINADEALKYGLVDAVGYR